MFFQQTNLICEISPDGFAYIFENDVDKKIHGLYVFHFTGTGTAGQLKEIFDEQPLLHKNYKKVLISYSGEESALLPEELYQPGENELLLNTLYGDLHDGAVATDLVADKKIYNVYRIPADIHKVIVDQFPVAVISHQYSLLIKQPIQGDVLTIIFYKEMFVAGLIMGGELQAIHSYVYHSGADVVYHLLNMCSQFSGGKIPLQVTGMIEKDSDLYSEIVHYFPAIDFEGFPAGHEFSAGLQALPAHYFSHLFSLASCV